MSLILILLVVAGLLIASRYVKDPEPTGYGLTFDPRQVRDNRTRFAEYRRRLNAIELITREMGERPEVGTTWWWRAKDAIDSQPQRAMRGLRYQTPRSKLKAIR